MHYKPTTWRISERKPFFPLFVLITVKGHHNTQRTTRVLVVKPVYQPTSANIYLSLR